MHSRSKALWTDYAHEFEELWGIEPGDAWHFGNLGGFLFDAECQELGSAAYRTSVILPIRNAFYNAFITPKRWNVLSKCELKEPILDYGCGVGFLLRWLKREGYDELYGYEVEGVQKRVLRNVTARDGIKIWDNNTPSHFGTILCLNVLEHLTDPLPTLTRLRSMCNNLIANCADDPDRLQHTLNSKEIEDIKASLREHGELYGDLSCRL